MSILTGRELEFLASLNISWSRLYWNELSRLLKEENTRGDFRIVAAPSSSSTGFMVRQPAKSWC
jgi:hypothetical protein